MNDSDNPAEDRTDWAEDRTGMANERTFAGWLRTGMAAIAVAVGLQVVFREIDPTWLGKAVATVFLLIAIFIFWTAQQKARDADKRLSRHKTDAPRPRNYTIMAAVFVLAAVFVGVVLWML